MKQFIVILTATFFVEMSYAQDHLPPTSQPSDDRSTKIIVLDTKPTPGSKTIEETKKYPGIGSPEETPQKAKTISDEKLNECLSLVESMSSFTQAGRLLSACYSKHSENLSVKQVMRLLDVLESKSLESFGNIDSDDQNLGRIYLRNILVDYTYRKASGLTVEQLIALVSRIPSISASNLAIENYFYVNQKTLTKTQVDQLIAHLDSSTAIPPSENRSAVKARILEKCFENQCLKD